jgi:hypothetical protein
MNFYSIASIIALVILIICLIGIGILMQYQNAGITFPLHPNKCPDLWTLSSDGTTCISNNKNTGTIDKSTVGFGQSGSNYTISPLTSSKATCDKYLLARKNGINWDGVSNFNGCS